MSKTLKVYLNKGLIIEGVKSEVFISGQTEKLADGSNNAKVYNETAGDDLTHERKLKRTLRGAIGRLEAFMVDFVDPSGKVAGSELSITDNISDDSDDFFLAFAVNDRFNASLSSTIAQLMQEYLINEMVCLWWAAVVDRKNDVNQYATLANEALVNIRRCLQKTSPTQSVVSFDVVSGKITEEDSDSSKSSLLKAFTAYDTAYETQENGIYVVDNNGNIGASYLTSYPLNSWVLN